MAKKYTKYELQRLLSKQIDRERKAGAGGRPFKLDLKKRFLMLFDVCYRLYITYIYLGVFSLN
jgi:hypothetical protein